LEEYCKFKMCYCYWTVAHAPYTLPWNTGDIPIHIPPLSLTSSNDAESYCIGCNITLDVSDVDNVENVYDDDNDTE
jgi:hypothetical protein